MADSLRKDPKVLRTCILYEVLHGRNVEEAYQNVCKVAGNDAVSYIDFDYWFYRFYNGNHDLDYDKGRDPKSLMFSDLPADSIRKIMQTLELKDQLNLRKMSHGFRCLVDVQKPAYKTINVISTSDSIWVQFNSTKVAYTNIEVAIENFGPGGVKVIQGVGEISFVERAINDLAIAIKNPTVKLESLNFDYNENGEKNSKRMFEGMRNLLKSLDHKISVKSISMNATNQEKLSEIISHLKPGHLERIEIAFFSLFTKSVHPTFVNIDEIITLDQWKMAKHVTINTSVSAPIENFFHFKSFNIGLDSDITGMLIHLRDTLPKLTEIPNCTLNIDYALNARNYEKILGPRRAMGLWNVNRFPIPGSNQHLLFEFRASSIRIYPTSRS